MGAAGHDVQQLVETIDMADTTTDKMVGLDAGRQAQSPGVVEEPGPERDLSITKVDGVIARLRGTSDHRHPEISVELGRCVVSCSKQIWD